MTEPPAFTRVRRLGAGAAGEVWLAESPGGPVALKIAAPGRSLASEASALRGFSHPLVPGLVAADEDGAWLARAYAEGQRVTSWAHGRPLEALVDCFVQLAEVVDELHRAGIVHGDLSPSNVLVDPTGTPRVIDVGADLKGAAGAVGWVAPERLRGGDGSVAGDVYGLGALAYAMFTGRPPYDRGSAHALGLSASTNLPVPPSSLRADLPVGLEELALSALAWTAHARPRAARDLATAARRATLTVPRAPVVGMADEREALRRAVVDTARGEGGVVVLYGPPGCGRRTLVDEALRAAAREQLPVAEVPLPAVAAALVSWRDPRVVVVDADDASAIDVAAALERAGECTLVLVRARGPVRALARGGAVHLRPPSLDVDDVAFLLRARRRDPGDAPALWTRTRGVPGAVAHALSGRDPTPSGLGPEALDLLRRLQGGPHRLPELAVATGLGEHAILDLLEPCFATGAAWCSDDGATLYGFASK